MPQTLRKIFFATLVLFLANFYILGADTITDTGKISDSGVASESSKSYDPIIVGSDFFVKEGSKFLNLSGADLSIQPDYILKTDDVFVIDVWGELDLHYSLTINKDGFIVVPNIGRIDLRGLTYEQGKRKILNQFANTYSFYIDKNEPGAGKAHLDITLGKKSGVKVYLSGEVVHPGVVMLNGANSSVIAAVAAGGGLKEAGSVRNIQITHTDGIKSVFDLYEFLLKGKLSQENKYLRDGDIVYVPHMKSKAYALGALVNPGTYEINSSETVETLVDFAGGFSSSASRIITISNANDDTYNENKKLAKVEENFSSLGNYKIQDNDIILANEQLNSKPYSFIEITGHGARYNGQLKFEKGLTIDDYINRAGGLYRDAYKNIILQTTSEDGALFFKILDTRAVLSRNKDENVQLAPGDKLIIEDNKLFYNKNFAFIEGYFKKPQMMELNKIMKISDVTAECEPRDDADIENAVFIHDGKNIKIDISKIQKNPDLQTNFTVLRFDKLLLPKSQPYVDISGEVWSPGFYPFVEGKTAEYYIDLAGGFTDNANKYKTTVTDQSGRIDRAYYWLWFFDPEIKRAAKIKVPTE